MKRTDAAWRDLCRRVEEAERSLEELQARYEQLSEELVRERAGNSTLAGQLRIAVSANQQNAWGYRPLRAPEGTDALITSAPRRVVTLPPTEYGVSGWAETIEMPRIRIGSLPEKTVDTREP